MPTTKIKNTLYRIMLPLCAPYAGRNPISSETGHPLVHRGDFIRLIRRHHVLGSCTLLSAGGGSAAICTSVSTPPHHADENTFFRVASSGTKALYTFFYWYKTAKDASFMFIDEFDAFYHYELAESIVMILEKMPNTQVIITSHNTNLLTNRIMRPDCYFILTKDKLTSFANATTRELREGHNLEKLYMSGEFNG